MISISRKRIVFSVLQFCILKLLQVSELSAFVHINFIILMLMRKWDDDSGTVVFQLI